MHTNAARGLSRRAARSRFKKHGPNTLFDSRREGVWAFLRPLVTDPAVCLMLASVFLSFLFSGWEVGAACTALLVLSAACTVPTFTAWVRGMERISKYRIPTVQVVREGRVFSVSARHIVPGDLLILRAGDLVPCDCRLIESEGLRVLTLTANEDGTPRYMELPKDPDAAYAHDDPQSAPYIANTLYGASEILLGEARAIAVETGARTYLGSIPSFAIPREGRTRGAEHNATHAIRPYLSAYGWLMIVLLLVLTVIAIFAAPDGYGIMELFLPLAILTGAASPALLSLYFQLFKLHGRVSANASDRKEDRVILKSERADALLGSVTDVLVVGHRASSDGIPHFWRAAVARGEIIPDPNAPQPLLQPLCEAFCLLQFADTGLSTSMFETGEDDTVLLSELIRSSLTDVSALRVRLVQCQAVPSEPSLRLLDVALREKHFKLFFCEDQRLIKRCILCEDGAHMIAVSPELRDRLLDFYVRSKEEAARCVTVARQTPEGTLALVGMVSMREEFQAVLPSVNAELTQCGVRTTFFLTDPPSCAVAYAKAAQLGGGILQKSERTPDLSGAALREARVCIGFSERELVSLLDEWKREGRRVALLCGNTEDRVLLTHAAVTLSCDPTEYHKREAEEGELSSLPCDGMENSARCSQSIRRRADALICRATRHGGGLFAVLQAISGSRTTKRRMQLLLSFLLSAQLTRLVIMALAVCFGISPPEGGMMLAASILPEVAAALWFLHLPIPQSALRTRSAPDANFLVALLRTPQTIAATLVLPAVCTLYSAILMWCGVITPSEASSYLLVSLLLTLLVRLYVITVEVCGRISVKRLLLPGLCTLLPLGAVILLSSLFPAVGGGTGLGEWTLVTACSLPLLPLGVLGVKIFSAFFDRTAK